MLVHRFASSDQITAYNLYLYKSYLDFYVEALESLGMTLHDDFEIWNTTLCCPKMLRSFDIVVWLTGDFSDPISEEEKAVITDYVDNGGNLFISSKLLGEQLNGTSFYESYFKAILRGYISTMYYIALNDTVESGANGWSYNGTWNITNETYRSPTHCWYSGVYNNSTVLILESPEMDISYFVNADLSFWTKYSLETDADYGYIDVSVDGGLTWITVGNITGNNTADWAYVSFNITPYISARFKVRFRLVSNPTVSWDGWWIDDIVIDGSALEPIVASSGSIFSGSYWLAGSDSANNAEYSEKLEVVDDAVPLFDYYTGSIAALGYEGVYKLVYFAFPFEAIKDDGSRIYVMRKVLEYLNTTGKPTSISAPDSLTVPLQGDITINIKLESEGAALSGKEVEFFIRLEDGWVSLGTKVTNADGMASIVLTDVPYPVGQYRVAVVFYGDSTYARTVKFINLNVRKWYTKIDIVGSTEVPDSGGYIFVRILDENNKTFSVDVVLDVAGLTYDSKTNSSGVASIWVYGLRPGTYRAVVRHFGDEYRYANETTFTLTVKDDDTSGPVIEIVNASANISYDEDLVIEAAISDESGIYGATIYYSVNDGLLKNVSMVYDAARNVWRGIIPAVDIVYGNLSWYIVAYDADGDYVGDVMASETDKMVTMIIDDTPPEIRGYMISPLQPKFGDTIIIRASVFEPEDASGVALVSVVILGDNNITRELTMTYDGTLYSAEAVGLAPGNYTCRIVATDSAGNTAMAEFTFVVAGYVRVPRGWTLLDWVPLAALFITMALVIYVATITWRRGRIPSSTMPEK